jgi:serine/threonine-protein kinase
VRVGPYSLHGTIASGGFGQVDAATVVDANGTTHTVAVKRVRADRAGDGALEMLADEARLVSRIRHPNVIGVLDVRRTETELFVVMEYVDGETLSYFLRRARKRNEPIPLSIVSAIVVGALYGLNAAHDALDENGAPLGIVHRDVSLPNIMVGTDGRSRLLDFGVAKAEGRLQNTSIGELKGKLAYMAPEQLALQPVTPRSDLYAVGVVLWELITSRRLFDGPDGAATIDKVLKGNVEPPSKYASGVPLALEQLVLRALAHDPAERFATGAEMAQALAACVPPAPPEEVAAWVVEAAGEALSRRRPDVVGKPAPPTTPDVELPDLTINEALLRRERDRAHGRGRGLMLLLAMVIFVLAVAAVTAVIVHLRSAGPDPEEATEEAGATTVPIASVPDAAPSLPLAGESNAVDAALDPADASADPAATKKAPRRYHRHPRRPRSP